MVTLVVSAQLVNCSIYTVVVMIMVYVLTKAVYYHQNQSIFSALAFIFLLAVNIGY